MAYSNGINYHGLIVEFRNRELTLYKLDDDSGNFQLNQRHPLFGEDMDLERIAMTASMDYLKVTPGAPIYILPTRNIFAEHPREANDPLWRNNQWYWKHKDLFGYDRKTKKVFRVNSNLVEIS